MSFKRIRKHIRRFKRRLHSRRFVLTCLTAFIIIGSLGYAVYMHNKHLTVNPASYQPLLRLVARAESSDNYNAYFGNAGNTSIHFTDMTIDQVLQWQSSYVDQGSPSDAIGRYQIISPTLVSLVQQLGIDTGKKFDPATQDQLAIYLLERRGAKHYVNNKLTRHQFAANLAQEWAALPKTVGKDPDSSYYAGDGINQSLVSVDEVLKAIEPIQAK